MCYLSLGCLLASCKPLLPCQKVFRTPGNTTRSDLHRGRKLPILAVAINRSPAEGGDAADVLNAEEVGLIHDDPFVFVVLGASIVSRGFVGGVRASW